MRYIILSGAIVILCLYTGGCLTHEGEEPVSSSGVSAENTAGIEWVHSISEGIFLAEEHNKPVMIDFYADWCTWCRRMNSETYSNPEVIELTRNFINVKVDVGRERDKAGSYNVQGLPTVVFLNSEGKVIERVVGYKDSSAFLEILHGVLSE